MLEDKITAVITTSPIPSHPSIHIIRDVYDSIRAQLPDIGIFILADGVRTEQSFFSKPYRGYISHLQNKYGKKFVKLHNKFYHQAAMLREFVLHENRVSTPYLLFMEHDWKFVGDPIDWKGVVELLEKGAVDCLRFAISKERKWQLDRGESQRPVPHVMTDSYCTTGHIGSVEKFFKPLLTLYNEGHCHLCSEGVPGNPIGKYFAGESKRFNAAIYWPSPDPIRLHHLDGRGAGIEWAGPKLPMVL